MFWQHDIDRPNRIYRAASPTHCNSPRHCLCALRHSLADTKGAFAPRLELLYEVLKIGGSRATRSVLQIQLHCCPASCTCARDHWPLVSSMSLNASMIGYRIPERSSPGSRPSTYSYLPLTRPGRPPMSTCVLVDLDTENWNDGYQNFHAP